ncbi:MAG: hypothetical protein O3A01_03935 [bacterium]|nr:hypothetical protein [bacterium]
MSAISATRAYDAAVKFQQTYTKTYMKETSGESDIGLSKNYRSLDKGMTEGEYALKIWDKKELFALLQKVSNLEKLDSPNISKTDLKYLTNTIFDAILNAHRDPETHLNPLAQLSKATSMRDVENLLAELTAAAANASEREELYDLQLQLLDPEVLATTPTSIMPMWRNRRYSIFSF